MEPLQVGGAVALALAGFRLAEKAITSVVSSFNKRNGNGHRSQSEEVRELKQVNASLIKISETLVVMKSEQKQTLTKVSDNAKTLDKVKSGVNWLKWSAGSPPETEEG